jgi:hypothetical protein
LKFAHESRHAGKGTQGGQRGKITCAVLLHSGTGRRKRLDLTRGTFDAQLATLASPPRHYGSDGTFDAYKRRDLAQRDSQITGLRTFIKECQTRYDGWKQTHRREGDAWVEV